MSCPDCFRGGISTSHPTGNEAVIHSLDTYVAPAKNVSTPKGLIIMITDAFGWKFANNRVLCDHYAEKGFLVYCPDFMNGNAMDPRAIPLMDKLMEPASWFTTIFYKPVYAAQTLAVAIPWKRKTSIPLTHPKVVAFFQALRTSPPPFDTDDLKIGAAGFCWGGKHAMLLAQDPESSRVQRHESQLDSGTSRPLLDCVFTAHPSYINVPNDIEPISIPISVAIGDKDMAMKEPVALNMKEILNGKKQGDYEVNIIAGAKHGFAVRNHPNDDHEIECAKKAEDQATEWFSRWFAI